MHRELLLYRDLERVTIRERNHASKVRGQLQNNGSGVYRLGGAMRIEIVFNIAYKMDSFSVF